jgi:hypothetical protein
MLYKICMKSHSLQEDLETEIEAKNKVEAFGIFRQQLAFAEYSDGELYNMIKEMECNL